MIQQFNEKKLLFFIVLILGAYFCGNFFGLYSKNNSNLLYYFNITILSLELINWLRYSQKTSKNLENLILILNNFKRGFLIGVFVEAFKVGS